MGKQEAAAARSTPFRMVCGRFFRNPSAVFGLAVFVLIICTALAAGIFLDYREDALGIHIADRLQKPGAGHLLGTDEMGRDILSRILFGARSTLFIAAAATAVSVLLGGLFGAASGYFGGLCDVVIMRVMEVIMCLPSMLLAIAIVVALGSSVGNMILAIGISYIPRFARIVRSSILGVRNTEYVQAAEVIGTPAMLIVFRHILRNCMGPIIVQTTLIFASAILSISSLSFLGLGIQAPTPEWGNMLSSGKNYMRGNAHLVLAPGFAIFFSIFSLNLLGDGLRDALDPRMAQ